MPSLGGLGGIDGAASFVSTCKEAMMRTTLLTLTLIATVLAACGTSQPGKPTPTVLGTQGPGQTTEPMPHY